MFNSLLELIVWGSRSRTWKHWTRKRQMQLNQRRQFNELAWLWYDWLDYVHG
jgi:hypothetical protein